MDIKNNNKIKKEKNNFKRFLNSWKNSFAGLKYVYTHELSFWIQSGASVLTIILGIIFKISFFDVLLLLIAYIILMIGELLNAAIEATVDMVTEEYHPLAKIAKDCASSVGLVGGFLVLIVCIYVFLPYITNIILGV